MYEGYDGRNFAFANFRLNSSTLIGGSATSGLGKRILRTRRSPTYLAANYGYFKRGVIYYFTINGSFFGGYYLILRFAFTRDHVFVFRYGRLIAS